MEQLQPILALAFKAIALAMAVAGIVLAALKMSPELWAILLGVGLLALALATIIGRESVA
ncbi:MAG: hypothetical protein SVP26_10855 [Chloroflexota bacterium]|nr:hypothetical protein [Chloroflexota bacterium]